MVSGTGIGAGKLDTQDLLAMDLCVPSIVEQTKIANFLTAVDEKISQLTQKCALLTQYKKGVMQKIFSQALRFKDDEGREFADWEEQRLGDVGEIITGKTPSTADGSLWNGDIQFVTPTDITDQKYQHETQRKVAFNSKLKILPTHSIMFTCIASIGKMSLSVSPCITNQQINALIPKGGLENEYIYYALLNITDFIKSTQANTTLPIINKTEFSKFVIPVPTLAEQTKIANLLTAIDDKIANAQAQLEAAKQYKQGLLQQMFV
jgi:type I restriction enzyme S subunit